ncbi:MAG TPA: hypothetical protein VGG10_05275 [Rhizomicrobium sp.]|jgi:hypothetical protein
MTTTNWRSASTGDFAKKGKWDHGAPGANTDAVIAATGADYIVKVISADAAHTLTLDSANATLLEKGQGSLDVGTLNIEAGTAVLTTANTIGSIVMTGGDLEFSSSASIGDAAISLKQAILSATASAQVANSIAITNGHFEVGNGATLKLDGHLTFDTATAESLKFAYNEAGADGSGVIDLDGSMGALSAHTSISIDGVTLATAVSNNSAFETLISEAQSVVIRNHGVLDLTHQNNVTLDVLQGTGEILNRGSHESATFVNSFYDGTIKGDFDITMEGGFFAGAIALKPGDAIHVIGGGGLGVNFKGDAPAIDLQDPQGDSGGDLSLIGATFSGAGPAIDLGTGQDNNLKIDHTFTGTITNFGGHGGGTDHIFIYDEVGHGNPTLQYEANAEGTGGELVVQYGTAPAFDLTLNGHYVQGDFTVDPDESDEIDCSAEQPAPHLPAHVVDALI